MISGLFQQIGLVAQLRELSLAHVLSGPVRSAAYPLFQQLDRIGIERLFRIKPENLDIQKVEITHTEVNREGHRGRTKARLVGEMLNPKQPRTIEVMLFWEKIGEKWNLRLKSSLNTK